MRCHGLWSGCLNRSLGLGLLMLSGGMIAGCAGADPLKAWQKSVETTVQANGEIDLSLLREVNARRSRYVDRPERITVNELGIPGPWGSRRDAQGLLVGVRTVNGAAWYVFTVGVVRLAPDRPDSRRPHNEIEDIFIAGLADNHGRLIWVIDDTQQEAFARYMAYRANSVDDRDPRSTFPGRTDEFQLEVRPGDSVLVIRERNSGAEWQLPVATPTAPTS